MPGASAPPGTTPARGDPSSADSTLSPTQQQCLTPPSVRRREARIARCTVMAQARANARREAAAGEDGDGRVREADGEPRRGYAAEEVDARRAGRREAAWQGWEAEAAAYEGPQVGERELVRPDGTVDWASLDEVEPSVYPVGADGMLPLGYTAEGTYEDVLRSLNAPAALPPPELAFRLPSLPAALATQQLPHNTLPVVLGALYVAARAFGVGTRRPAPAPSGIEAKARRWEHEHRRRD